MPFILLACDPELSACRCWKLFECWSAPRMPYAFRGGKWITWLWGKTNNAWKQAWTTLQMESNKDGRNSLSHDCSSAASARCLLAWVSSGNMNCQRFPGSRSLVNFDADLLKIVKCTVAKNNAFWPCGCLQRIYVWWFWPCPFLKSSVTCQIDKGSEIYVFIEPWKKCTWDTAISTHLIFKIGPWKEAMRN